MHDREALYDAMKTTVKAVHTHSQALDYLKKQMNPRAWSNNFRTMRFSLARRMGQTTMALRLAEELGETTLFLTTTLEVVRDLRDQFQIPTNVTLGSYRSYDLDLNPKLVIIDYACYLTTYRKRRLVTKLSPFDPLFLLIG